MAVGALVDGPVVRLWTAVQEVRETPAPLGQVAARLGALARTAAELRGTYLRDLASAEHSGEAAAAGYRSVADLLVETAGLPAWQARADAALARRLAVLPGLLDAVAGGGLEVEAARHLARAWSALPVALRDQATARALIALGGLIDLTELRSKVDELLAALQPTVTDDAVAAARDAAGLVLTDVGAETRLTAHTDVLTGEWLRDVLVAKAEADRGLADGRSSDARLLDALLDIVRASIGTAAVPGTDGADGGAPQLVIVATVDDLAAASASLSGSAARGAAASGAAAASAGASAGAHAGPDAGPDGSSPAEALAGLLGSRGPRPSTSARTRGGTRLGPRLLLGLCCGARVARLLLDPTGHPLDSTPSARQLSRPERRALEHRADYRCERQGCGRPARTCVPHHVVPWGLGGESTLANTVLLCRSCHHVLHDRQKILDLTSERRIGPTGWVQGGPDPC